MILQNTFKNFKSFKSFIYNYKDTYDYCNYFKDELNINEIFDSGITVDYYIPYNRNNSTFIRGRFGIDGISFNIIFEINQDGLGINFERVQNGKVYHSTLNDLNAKQVVQVFSTVIQESKLMIMKYKPNIIYVETDEPKKLNTYGKIIDKLNINNEYTVQYNKNSIVLLKGFKVSNSKISTIKFVYDKFKDII